MLKIKNQHHGIGLLELLLSLTIIAAVILLATRYFSQASEASKVTQTTQIIRTLIDASFKWVEGKPNFGGDPGKNNSISMYQLTTGSGILPNDWLNKTSPWGGTELIKVESYGFTKIGEQQNRIQITIPNVPISACKSLNDILEKQGIDTSLSTPCKSRDYIIFYPKNAS